MQGEGIGSTTGRGVISRDAITASLHQNRKRRPGKWGRSQPAGLVLRPCPHSPRRPPALCLPARRLCPHRRCCKKRHQRHPPRSQPPPPQGSLICRKTRVNLLILHFDYSSGSELRLSVRTPSRNQKKHQKHKTKSAFEGIMVKQ